MSVINDCASSPFGVMMNRATFAIAILVLLFAVRVCVADDRLVNIPYNPQTDLPKLAGDLGVSQESVLFHGRCGFIHLNEWIQSVGLQSVQTCVITLTPDQLILSTWKADTSMYVSVFRLGYGDIKQAALSVEGTKYQLQLTTALGFLAITTAKYRAKPPGDSSDAAEILKHLAAKGIVVADSPGRVDLKISTIRVVPLGGR
ncbi:MAG: hypothetical protein Q8K91_08470 [Hylemonella sp.]|nr:hypothetical protein [Hylemonella sp.]MDP1937225.1 hypothetical protein [Hylemonella sp.]